MHLRCHKRNGVQQQPVSDFRPGLKFRCVKT
jgi:hypothetical protein